MNKILIVIVSLFSLTTYSQDVYDIIAKETCECITKKNIDISKSSSSDISGQLGVCLISSYSAHKMELPEKDRIDFNDEAGMGKLGEMVALKMLDKCPDIIIALGTKANEDEKKEGASKSQTQTINGQFLQSVSSDFITVSVKDNSGRIHSLLFLTFFENSNLISENLLKKNQKVEVEYYEQEFYDVKSKDFRLFKILKSIKKI